MKSEDDGYGCETKKCLESKNYLSDEIFQNKQFKLNKYGVVENLTDKAIKGDIDAIVKLIIPSHVGIRVQTEGSVPIPGTGGLGPSFGGGHNSLQNIKSGETGDNEDAFLTGGPGIGFGGSVTIGILIGWGSSNIKDVSSGDSATLGATAAAGPAISISVSAPIDQNGLIEDPYYGQVPATLYVGAGFGMAYATVGIGGSKSMGFAEFLKTLIK